LVEIVNQIASGKEEKGCPDHFSGEKAV